MSAEEKREAYPRRTKPPQERFADENIGKAVHRAVSAMPGVSLNDKGFAVEDRVVRIFGNVESLAAKERTARVIEAVRGVRGVVNHLEVASWGMRDSEIEEWVQSAIGLHPESDAWNVRVSVENGVVTLSGTVATEAQRKLVRNYARDTGGVRGIQNNLKVRNGAEQKSDRALAFETREMLLMHPLLSKAHIIVDVQEGNVMLSGAVAAAAQRKLAKEVAKQVGAQRVDVSGLEVDPSDAGLSEARVALFEFRRDLQPKTIKKGIKAAMARDARIPADKIEVKVDSGGVVQLSGEVDTLHMKRLAANAVRNVVGVKSVENQIKLREGELRENTIEEQIGEALRRDAYVSRNDIAVEFADSTAILRGTVDDAFEKARAEQVVEQTRGVGVVANRLETEEEVYGTFVASGWVDPELYVNEYPWVGGLRDVPQIPDRELEEEVKSELWWSPWVDSDDVYVEAHDGRVMLSGMVDTWEERRSVEEEAREAGAIAIVNRLKVRGNEYDG